MSYVIGLIGYPLKHSVSPYFQQAALDYYHLDIRYRAWEMHAEELKVTMSRLKEQRSLGANVTVPYKETVLPLLDGVDDMALLIGAVNTIVKKDNELWGYNTDTYGFMQALKVQGAFDPQGKGAVILGAGGAARAASFALVKEGVSSLSIVNRSLERAQLLADRLSHYASQAGLKAELAVLPWQSLISSQVLVGNQLVVNCTTLGMKHGPGEGMSPLSMDVIPESILVYDLVYNPRPSPLLDLARRAGANILGGLPMLVYQGAASFELWTGKEAPIDVMYDRAEEMVSRGQR